VAPLPPSNPLFPERIDIPWIAVPQPTANSQASGMPGGSKQPSLSSASTNTLLGAVNDSPLRFPTSSRPMLEREFPEILYAGNVPIQLYPLPLNSIMSRLQSFGFLIQFPTIVLPKPVGQ
jgi:hypothetical protein